MPFVNSNKKKVFNLDTRRKHFFFLLDIGYSMLNSNSSLLCVCTVPEGIDSRIALNGIERAVLNNCAMLFMCLFS